MGDYRMADPDALLKAVHQALADASPKDPAGRPIMDVNAILGTLAHMLGEVLSRIPNDRGLRDQLEGKVAAAIHEVSRKMAQSGAPKVKIERGYRA